MNFYSLPSSQLAFIQNLIAAGVIRSKLVNIAAAHALANNAPLPNAKLNNTRAHFNDVYQDHTLRFLDALQAVAPIDFKEIQRLAPGLYEVRCKNAFGCAPSCTGKNGVYNVFHVGLGLSGEELGLVADSSGKFASYYSAFDEIICTVSKEMERRASVPA